MSFIKTSHRIVIMLLLLVMTACASFEKTKQTTDTPIGVNTEIQHRFERALNHQKQGEYDQAKVIYQSIVSQEPLYISPVLNLGIIAINQARFDEAKNFFEAVIESDKTHPVALNYLGFIAREAGDFDLSETYYRQIIVVDPNDLNAIRNLGILLDLYRGRLEDALALYEQYQGLLAEPDPKIKDWIFDTKNRLKAK